MFRAHSLLWSYLWVAPNLLLFILGFLIWKRGIVTRVHAFIVFAVLSAVSELAVYAADVLPTVGPRTFWGIDWASLLIVGVLKFLLIGEIFSQVFGSYRSVARLGRLLIQWVGVGLILVATAAAAYAPQNSRFGIVSGLHLLEQAVYLIESGLLVFIFLFSFYFHLSWERRLFGITLGLSISSCVQLGSWALIDNGGLPDSKRMILVFVNMATYHFVVFIWYYYLLVPGKTTQNAPQSQVPPPLGLSVDLPEHEVEAWSEELERLIHK
jgi:hypothetical protein